MCKYASIEGNSPKLFKMFIFLLLSSMISLISGCGTICLAFMTLLCVLFIVSYVLDRRTDACIRSMLNDCDVLEKANNMTIHACNDVVMTLNISKKTRSRYSQYIYYINRQVDTACRRRNREPSRLPTRVLKQLSRKSKKFRRFVFAKNIGSREPKCSKLSYIYPYYQDYLSVFNF